MKRKEPASGRGKGIPGLLKLDEEENTRAGIKSIMQEYPSGNRSLGGS